MPYGLRTLWAPQRRPTDSIRGTIVALPGSTRGKARFLCSASLSISIGRGLLARISPADDMAVFRQGWLGAEMSTANCP